MAGILVPLLPASWQEASGGAAVARLEILSVNDAGEVGDSESYLPDLGGGVSRLSGDGRYALFLSRASNLGGDIPGEPDLFVRDRSTKITERVAGVITGGQGDPGMDYALSNDGSTMAFVSAEQSLRPTTESGCHGSPQGCLYVMEVAPGSTLPSEKPEPFFDTRGDRPAQIGGFSPSLTDDGKTLAFLGPSADIADNHGEEDPTNGQDGGDVLVVDRGSSSYEYIYDAPRGCSGGSPIISGDGELVAFLGAADLETCTGNLTAYVHDRVVDQTYIASRSSTNEIMHASEIAFSSDGSTLVFKSGSDDLALGDSNGEFDIYARDLHGVVTELVSVRSNDAQFQDPDVAGREGVSSPTVSGDGYSVAFEVITGAGLAVGHSETTIWLRNMRTGKTTELDEGKTPAISANGGSVAFQSFEALTAKDDNGTHDVYVRDLFATTELEGTVRDGDLQADGHNRLLRGAKVELRQGNDVVAGPVATGEDGRYRFPNIPPGTYRLRVTLEDLAHAPSEDSPLFDIRYEAIEPTEPMWIEVQVELVDRTTRRDVAFSSHERLVDYSDAIHAVEHLIDDTAALYTSLFEYIAWLKKALPGVVLDRALPVEVYFGSNIKGESNAAYFRDATSIHVGEDVAGYWARDGIGVDRGPVVEWHEFTHHVSSFEQWPEDGCPGENHGGYWNPSTCDSLVEGFAEFLPVLALATPDAERLGVNQRGNDAYDGFQGVFLDDHWKAWGQQQVKLEAGTTMVRREEFAVAALLWDLVDRTEDSDIEFRVIGTDGEHHFVGERGVDQPPEGITDEIELSIQELWPLILGEPSVGRIYEILRRSDVVPADQRAVSIDLDGDGIPDVAPFDVPFLMHGFHTVEATEFDGHHMHYDVDSVDPDFGGGIGFTESIDPATGRRRFRAFTPEVPGSEVAVEVVGPDGKPVPGASAELTFGFGSDERTVVVPLEDGTEMLTLEMPPFYEGILLDDQALPTCDEALEALVVEVEIRGMLGTSSGDPVSTDSCTFQQAVAAGGGGPALTVTVDVPRAQTVLSAQVKRQGRNVLVNGELEPGLPRGRVVVSLQKKKAGKWRTVAKKKATLSTVMDRDDDGIGETLYERRVKRTKGKACRVIVRFAGTVSHKPSKAVDRFKC